MIVILVIFLIIPYFFIGYVVTKLFEKYNIIKYLDDDDFVFTIVLIFFPFVLIGVVIKVLGTKMVADIKVLSATTFLEELYMLFDNNWKYTRKEKHADGISIPKNEDGEYDEASAMSGILGMFAAMSSNDRDDFFTWCIANIDDHDLIIDLNAEWDSITELS